MRRSSNFFKKPSATVAPSSAVASPKTRANAPKSPCENASRAPVTNERESVRPERRTARSSARSTLMPIHIARTSAAPTSEPPGKEPSACPSPRNAAKSNEGASPRPRGARLVAPSKSPESTRPKPTASGARAQDSTKGRNKARADKLTSAAMSRTHASCADVEASRTLGRANARNPAPSAATSLRRANKKKAVAVPRCSADSSTSA